MTRTIRIALVATLASAGLSVAHPAEAGRPSVPPIESTPFARLVYAGTCGWQGTGQVAYVVAASEAATVVTVRTSFEVGPNEQSRTSSYRLAPGATRSVGCTRGAHSMEWTRFSIGRATRWVKRPSGRHARLEALGDAVLDRARGDIA